MNLPPDYSSKDLFRYLQDIPRERHSSSFARACSAAKVFLDEMSSSWRKLVTWGPLGGSSHES